MSRVDEISAVNPFDEGGTTGRWFSSRGWWSHNHPNYPFEHSKEVIR